MTGEAVLHQVLERLACDSTTDAFFSADEVADWPSGTLTALIDCGLLQQATPALVIECHGCEARCAMPVEVTAGDAVRPARLRIICDRREDMGPIKVDPARLERWRITGEALASAVARWLGARSPTQSPARRDLWKLSVAGAESRTRVLDLSTEGVPRLTIGDQSIELRDLLEWKSGQVRFASQRMKRFLQQVGDGKETTEARRARVAARKAELIAAGDRSFIKTIAAEENLSETRVKKLLEPPKRPVGSWGGLVASSNPPDSPKKKAKS